MAEKPRLKETDEIFSSIGKGAANRARPLAVGAPPEEEARSNREPDRQPDKSPEPPAPLIDSLLDPPGEDVPQGRKRRRSKAGDKAPPEPKVDTRPLDFSKYGLPAQEAKEPEGPLEIPLPKVRRVTLPIEEPMAKSPEQPAPVPQKRSASPAPREEPQQGQMSAEPEPEIKPFVFADLDSDPEISAVPEPAREPETPRIVRPAKAERERPPESAPEPAAKAEQQQPQAPRQEDTPQEDPRGEFLQRLSSQFDRAFSDAFEGKRQEEEPPPRAAAPRRRTRKPYDFEVIPKDQPAAAPPPEDREADQEADAFLKEFAQQVKEEEEDRTELFKDTLTAKFERERERYLKELGIAPEEERAPEPEPEPQAKSKFKPPANRRLDIQIEPDMHRQPEEAASPRAKQRPDTPVTYSPSGAVRPLQEEPEEAEEFPLRPAEPEPQGSKSAEELLMELGRQQQPVGSRPRPRAMRPEKAEPAAALAQRPRNAPPEEKESWFKTNRRIISISAVAAVFLLVLITVPLLRLFRPEGGLPEASISSPAAPDSGDFTIYENRNFDVRGEYENVMIRKTGISVRNMSVTGHLVIADLPSQGEIVLEDITIGGELRLQNTGVDSLVLRNVSAKRILISNGSANVTLAVSGYGSIDTLEIRSPASIVALPTQGAEGSRTIQNALLSPSADSSILNVGFHGLELQTLVAGEGTVVELGEDTRVELLTGEGSLALMGTGRVIQLSIQQKENPLVLNLAAPVSNLALKGRGNVTVDSQIDSMVISDNLVMNGMGTISNLVLDVPLSGNRLRLGVADLAVNTLIANTETTLEVTGSGKVTELIANNSVYTLGNKVNLLTVNAGDVIYENEPDKINVKPGIRPPGTVSDNPNLDLAIASSERPPDVDTGGDDVSTVCGHPRESGGFLKGDGSAQNPYQVATAAQLAHAGEHLTSHFIQTAHIDISDDTKFVTGFAMIAGGGTPFSGSYDGNGYHILNLRISSGGENVGLFAENTGEIRNVNIQSGEVRGSSAERSFVGGVVGLNYQSGSVLACANGARVVGGAGAYVGGICGYNYSAKIRDCYNAAKITGTSHVGGVAGVNGDGATLAGSYNVGTIEGGEDNTGGVAGLNSSGGIVTNCYYLLETAVVGIGTGEGSAQEKDTDAMSSAQMVADLTAGNESSRWAKSDGTYTYPVLNIPHWEPETPG